MKWVLIMNRMINFARKIPCMLYLAILISIIIAIGSLRIVYGIKSSILLGTQLFTFVIVLIEPKFVLYLAEYKFRTRVFVFIIGVLICIGISPVGINSLLFSIIATCILCKILIYLLLPKTGSLSNRKKLLRSIIVSIASALFIIAVLFAIFKISIMEIHSLADVSRYVYTRTYYSQLPHLRSGYDLYSWIVFGVGACDEMAFVTKSILDEKNIEAYIAGFPGEDHYFTVIYTNDSWIVIDPGYYPSKAVSLKDRIGDRIREYGNISSLIVYIAEASPTKVNLHFTGFIELTQYYVPNDIFIIYVTYNGHPVSGARIVLKHKFHGNIMEIPGKGLSYYTNSSGYSVIHLGGSIYNKSSANPYDESFEIYINDKPTGIFISSTASGVIHYIEIDIRGLG